MIWEWPCDEIEDFMFNFYNSLFVLDLSNITVPIFNQTFKGYIHIFIYRHDNNSDKAGVWLWERECKKFIHFTGKAPVWWENMSIDGEMGIDNIANNTSMIDSHIKLLIQKQ